MKTKGYSHTVTYDNAKNDALIEGGTDKGVMLQVTTPLLNDRDNLDDTEYLRLRWPDAPLPIIHLALAALGKSVEQSCSRDSASHSL